ncbi:lysoplasmalogenase [Catenulispora pinisilvae]|uniref:lysoplasmalogenase n=1 Tax=Catenulispora pinisilvae TaxID=2705253 RepID=UPI001891A16F|nr:lysoplasmalogenase [Catenulispora pinisilvae]
MPLTLTLLTLVVAFADWTAVARRALDPASAGARRAEYVAKPLTMVALIAAALASAHAHAAPGVPGPNRATAYLVVATVAALVLSAVGDVFLMLPEDSPSADRNFVFGLAAFLLAHVAYIAAFVRLHTHGGYAISLFLTGLVLAGAVFATVGLRIRGAAGEEDPALAVPVLAYVTVISLLVVAAWWTGDLRIIPGALLFAASDAMIGWTRFVRRDWELDVPIIVTYHLAQILLVLGLVRR